MPTVAEIAVAVDNFMGRPKRIVGTDELPAWGPGHTRHELATYYPLEVEGEQFARLMVVGFRRERSLKFRLGILFPPMVCRLDYTDEYHPNTVDGVLDLGLPPYVDGPHYHSWPLNRRFFHRIASPIDLHDAMPYAEPGRSFDAILRWFCMDTQIESLPANHRIELPTPDQMEFSGV